jgi:4-aminobutyrate aminotransferase-like enzyme
VVREEKLEAHALEVGTRLIAGLRELQAEHELIREVRGSGFFTGIELVKDNQAATTEADEIVNRMREEGILLGTDGPQHNVLKIRPPMPFSASDADYFLATLAGVLNEREC